MRTETENTCARPEIKLNNVVQFQERLLGQEMKIKK